MSIEIEGVKGYEYQYLATQYLSLLYIQKDFIEIFVEDTEDARIVFEEGGDREELFVQVKKHGSNITMDQLCSWMAHFGKHQSGHFLLSHIAEGKKSAIFITSGRCNDTTSKFASQPYKHGGLSALSYPDIAEVIVRLKQQYGDDKPLSSKRKDTIHKFISNQKTAGLRNCLQKINIWERISVEDLKDKIGELLNKEFVIRPSAIDYVIKCLDECVRAGRDSGANIAQSVREVLLEHSKRFLPENLEYVAPPNYVEIEKALNDKNALLLTGMAFCGKTTLALALAQNLARQGYEVKQTSDFDGDYGALAFLREYANDKRLLLLEDPFGVVQAADNKVELAQKLRKLVVERASPERKIIVTTKRDILFEVFDKSKLADCSIHNMAWTDLSIADKELAYTMWSTRYGDDERSRACFEKIHIWMQYNNEGVFLELGEIDILKREHPALSDLESLTVDAIFKSARKSSEFIAQKIKGSGDEQTKAFLALGFCCNTIRPVSPAELAYVLSDAEETPALIQRDSVRSVGTIYGGRDPVPPSFPAYIQKYTLDSGILRCLMSFEKQGYIFRSKLSKEVRFSHPSYYYASKLLLMGELEESWETDEIELMWNRAIGALNKNVNLCMLDVLWYCINHECSFHDKIQHVLLKSLHSIFPATKDQAVVFLEKCFEELAPGQRDELIEAIKNFVFDKHLLWEKNEPFINPNDTIELGLGSLSATAYGKKSPFKLDEIQKIRDKQQASPWQVYETLDSPLRNELPLTFLNMAMTYDESIIREKAIYLIFKNHGSRLKNIASYLNDFDNCNVVFALFKGALQSWFTYGKNEKEVIMNYFLSNLARISVSIQAKGFMEDFGDEYSSKGLDWSGYDEAQKEALWIVWCKTFTEFFLKFPPQYMRMNESDMEYTMKSVVKYVRDSQLLLDLFEAWNAWLEKIRDARDYGMCLMEYVLLHLPMASKGRLELFSKMLQSEKTSIITSHVKHAVDNWTFVSGQEKQLVFDLLASARNDVIWVKAIALTRKTVPAEIQQALFGEALLDKPIYIILILLRNNAILENCLNVYCGYPQPLWWNGYHHSNCKLWNHLMAEVLMGDIFDTSFEIALREFVAREYNYDSIFDAFKDDVWDSLLNSPCKRGRVFKQLLQVSATQNQSNKELWSRYLDHCDEHERKESFATIVDAIEILEYKQYGYDGIYEQFERRVVWDEIYPLLKVDLTIVNMCEVYLELYKGTHKFVEESEQEKQLAQLREEFKKIILFHYRFLPPRMLLTNNIVKGTSKKMNIISQEMHEALEKRKETLFEVASKKEDTFEDNYALTFWNE